MREIVPGVFEHGNPAVPVNDNAVPPAAFWRRFTQPEREALQNILSTGTQNQKNKLNAFRDYILIGGNVELDDDYIVASVTMMETVGVIGAGRAAQILAAP
jgi:hypothetical protein